MAVKLRLKRMGAKKRPFYRIVAADSRSPRDGKFIELIGTYNPLLNPAEIVINKEIALKWLKDGAQLTDTVRDLFSKQGILKEFHESKINSAPKKEKVVKVKKVETKKETKTVKTVTKKTKSPVKATKKKAE